MVCIDCNISRHFIYALPYDITDCDKIRSQIPKFQLFLASHAVKNQEAIFIVDIVRIENFHLLQIQRVKQL